MRDIVCLGGKHLVRLARQCLTASFVYDICLTVLELSATVKLSAKLNNSMVVGSVHEICFLRQVLFLSSVRKYITRKKAKLMDTLE